MTYNIPLSPPTSHVRHSFSLSSSSLSASSSNSEVGLSSSPDEKVSNTVSSLFQTIPSLAEISIRGEDLPEEIKLSPKDFFEAFDLGFYINIFKEEDVEYIRSLFRLYKIGNHYRLNELFTFHFFSSLKCCEKLLSPSQEGLIGEWAGCYLKLQEALFVQSSSFNVIRSEEGFSGCYFQMPADALKALLGITQVIIDKVQNPDIEVLGARVAIPKHITGKSGIKRYKSKQIQQWREECAKTCKDWKRGISLFEKIASSSQHESIFDQHALFHLPGSSEMIPNSLENWNQTLQNLEVYLEVLVLGFDNLKEKEPLDRAIDKGMLKELLSLTRELQKTSDPESREAKIKEITSQLSGELGSKELRPALLKETLEEWKDFSIAYDTLCAQHDKMVSMAKNKNSLKIIESAIKKQQVLEARDSLHKELEKMLFEGARTQVQTNICSNSKILFESLLLLLNPQVSSSFAHARRVVEIARFLKAERECFSMRKENHPAIQEMEEALFQELSSCRRPYGKKERVLTILSELDSLNVHIVSAMSYPETRLFHQILSQKLNAYVTQLPQLGIFSASGYSKWEQIGWMARFFVLQHDLSIVLGKKEAGSSDLDIFPDEFLQWIELEEEEEMESPEREFSIGSDSFSNSLSSLEDITPILKLDGKEDGEDSEEELDFHPIESPKVGGSEIAPNSPESKEEEKQEQLSVKSRRLRKREKKLERALRFTKIEKKQKKEEIQPLDSQIFKADPRELLESRKLGHVKKALKRMGLQYIRSTGDHEIYVHPEDPRSHATVPEHSEIRRGTLQSIYHQVIGNQTGYQ